jgi:hypothetical protein
MVGRGALALGIVFVVIPWLVILADAALGFNLPVAVAMMLLFSIGLLFLSALATEA